MEAVRSTGRLPQHRRTPPACAAFDIQSDRPCAVRIVAAPDERTWVWTASGTATVVLEAGNY